MYRSNENGIASKYADRSKVCVASYSAQAEQPDYILQGGVALLFVTSLMLIISGVS